jgi:hypothetical protein
MLLVAALIFRYLAMLARGTFLERFGRLLGRPAAGRRVESLLRQYPERAEDFRGRVLPYMALRTTLDALACFTFVAAVVFFPPSVFGERDLAVLQRGSALIVFVALLMDTAAFCRCLLLISELKSSPEKAE